MGRGDTQIVLHVGGVTFLSSSTSLSPLPLSLLLYLSPPPPLIPPFPRLSLSHPFPLPHYSTRQRFKHAEHAASGGRHAGGGDGHVLVRVAAGTAECCASR